MSASIIRVVQKKKKKHVSSSSRFQTSVSDFLWIEAELQPLGERWHYYSDHMEIENIKRWHVAPLDP
jgi:hypothetical protein